MKVTETFVEVEKVVKVKERTGFTLELTENEAKSLMYICGAIGGSAFDTRRGDTSKVYNALAAAGLNDEDYAQVISGTITFLK